MPCSVNTFHAKYSKTSAVAFASSFNGWHLGYPTECQWDSGCFGGKPTMSPKLHESTEPCVRTMVITPLASRYCMVEGTEREIVCHWLCSPVSILRRQFLQASKLG